jgi:ferric-dicitrate binding protein FerR (iron transport regulator)
VPGHCERARQWVSAELDGRLSEFEQALLDGHLSGCAECSSFRASTTRVTQELRAAPLERLETPIAISRARRRFPFRIAPAVAALAVMAVGLGSILASADFRPGSPVSQAPPSSVGDQLSPTNGPVNLSKLTGLRRDRIVTLLTSVDTSRPQRAPSGGTVLR